LRRHSHIQILLIRVSFFSIAITHVTLINDTYYSNRSHASEEVTDPNSPLGTVVATMTLIINHSFPQNDMRSEHLTSETTVLRIAAISATTQVGRDETLPAENCEDVASYPARSARTPYAIGMRCRVLSWLWFLHTDACIHHREMPEQEAPVARPASPAPHAAGLSAGARRRSRSASAIRRSIRSYARSAHWCNVNARDGPTCETRTP